MTNGAPLLPVESRALAGSDPHASVEGHPSTDAGGGDAVEGRWLSWGRSLFAVVVVLVLIVLGVANIAMRSLSVPETSFASNARTGTGARAATCADRLPCCRWW